MPISFGIAPRSIYDAVPGLTHVNDTYVDRVRGDVRQDFERDQAWAKVRADRIQHQAENDQRAWQMFLNSGGGGSGGGGGGGRGGYGSPSLYAQTEAVNDRDARLASFQQARDAKAQQYQLAQNEQQIAGRMAHEEQQRSQSQDEQVDAYRQQLLNNGRQFTGPDQAKWDSLVNQESILNAQMTNPMAEARPKNIYPALESIRRQKRALLPTIETMTPEQVQKKNWDGFVKIRDGQQVFDDGPADHVLAPGKNGWTRFETGKKEGGGGHGVTDDKLLEMAYKAADSSENTDPEFHLDRLLKMRDRLKGGGVGAVQASTQDSMRQDMDLLSNVDRIQRSGGVINNPQTIAEIPRALDRVRGAQSQGLLNRGGASVGGSAPAVVQVIDPNTEARLREAQVGPQKRPVNPIPAKALKAAEDVWAEVMTKYNYNPRKEEWSDEPMGWIKDEKDLERFHFATRVMEAFRERRPVHVKTKEQANSLPSGTMFVDPNGTVRKVP